MRLLRRSIDIAVSCVGLVATSPIVLATAMAMAITNKAPPFFTQTRIGLNGQPFEILKIRSMKDAFNEAGEVLSEEERTTRLGRLVRKLKIDELPQLINVLKGEMSLVGPRPVGSQWPIASDPIRQSVRPGMSGLAQIRGGNSLSLEEVLAYDHAYVRNRKNLDLSKRIFMDATILASTPLAIMRQFNDIHFRAANDGGTPSTERDRSIV